MGFDFFWPVAVFAFSSLVTPGPNNLMLAASGMNFGFARSRSHISGICIGFCLMVFVICAGLGEVFERLPLLQDVLRYVCFAVVCWLAWRVAMSDLGDESGRSKPLTFLQAMLFQWVNPKGWTMTTTAAAAFISGNNVYVESILVSLVFFIISIGSSVFWTEFGVVTRQFFLQRPRWLRVFNVSMGLLLVAIMVPIVVS